MNIQIADSATAIPVQSLIDSGWSVDLTTDSGKIKLHISKRGDNRFLVIRAAEEAAVYGEGGSDVRDFIGPDAVRSAAAILLSSKEAG